MGEDMECRIDEMTNALSKDQLSVKISKIKVEYIDVICSSFGDYYII